MMTADEERGADVRGAAEAARRLRRQMSLGHPADVPIEIVARRVGLLIVEDSVEGARALTMRLRGGGVACVSALAEVRARRFDMAHELAHYLLHRALSHLPLCIDPGADPAAYAKSPTERESDVFAREYLMPRAYILAKHDLSTPSWELVRTIADDLLVSMTAAALRLVELCESPLALVRSTGGVVDWAKRSFRFGRRVGGKIERGRAIASESAAPDAPEGLLLPPREVRLSTWLDAAPEGTVIEHTLGVPGGALTLLALG